MKSRGRAKTGVPELPTGGWKTPPRQKRTMEDYLRSGARWARERAPAEKIGVAIDARGNRVCFMWTPQLGEMRVSTQGQVEERIMEMARRIAGEYQTHEQDDQN